MYRKPVTWITVAPEGRGNHAEASLRTVLGYVGATIIEPAGTRVLVARADLDPERPHRLLRSSAPGSQEVVRAFADGVRVTSGAAERQPT